jgi:hypothetical protein
MTAVWILLFVCTLPLPSCSQGDVSVANQSYTAARSVTLTVQSAPWGASLSASKEGKSKNEQIQGKSDMTPCRRVRNGQLATVKNIRRPATRPSGLGSICVLDDRCGDAVHFSLSTRRQCNGTPTSPKSGSNTPFRPTITARLALDGRFGDALLFTRS